MSSDPRAVLREETATDPVVSLVDARQRKIVSELSQRHAAFLRSLAHKLCRGQLDADDLVQDVFEKLLRHPLPESANERAWLSRVMNNLFIDKVRSRNARREDPIEEDPVSSAPVPGEWWETLSTADIRAQLPHLTDEQRETFVLFAFEGRTYDEIAAQLGIAKATVGTRILRARQRIRERLMKEQGNHE